MILLSEKLKRFQMAKDVEETRNSDNDEDNYVQAFYYLIENELSRDATGSDFSALGQIVMRLCFDIDLPILTKLKLSNFKVDERTHESVTIRFEDNDTVFRKTIKRSNNVTNCPLFALSLFLVVKWHNASSDINIDNCANAAFYDEVLSPNSEWFFEKVMSDVIGSTNELDLVMKSDFYEPQQFLIHLVFPWLPFLKQNLLLSNPTNFSLYFICELFETVASIFIRGTAVIVKALESFPHLAHSITGLVPSLIEHEAFQKLVTSAEFKVSSKLRNNKLSRRISRPKSLSELEEDIQKKTLKQHFESFSKTLLKENVKLESEITNLKSDIIDLSSKCEEILEYQKKLVRSSNQNKVVPQALELKNADMLNEKKYSLKRTYTESNSDTSKIHKNKILASPTLNTLLQAIESRTKSEQTKSDEEIREHSNKHEGATNMLPSTSNQMTLLTPKLTQYYQQPYATQRLKMLHPKAASPSEQTIFSQSPREYDFSSPRQTVANPSSSGSHQQYDLYYSRPVLGSRLPPITNYDETQLANNLSIGPSVDTDSNPMGQKNPDLAKHISKQTVQR